eukprot:TRINITY_DN10520_c2_g1_i2.p1 TRINITY_DN10520_c2_g1~~TRINITY_DN10520_c2_g1_i2.p1  ORF type:complete len:218 (-),score=-10.61 TRINITY_DN10520_c2_g1_i2:243-896(-)
MQDRVVWFCNRSKKPIQNLFLSRIQMQQISFCQKIMCKKTFFCSIMILQDYILIFLYCQTIQKANAVSVKSFLSKIQMQQISFWVWFQKLLVGIVQEFLSDGSVCVCNIQKQTSFCQKIMCKKTFFCSIMILQDYILIFLYCQTIQKANAVSVKSFLSKIQMQQISFWVWFQKLLVGIVQEFLSDGSVCVCNIQKQTSFCSKNYVQKVVFLQCNDFT